MRQLELSEIKQRALQIMIVIDQKCREHDIPYFMAYGALIGAIRHSGFIPWDDDIDIWVHWKDYERLNEILSTETEFDVISPITHEECPLLFTKISDSKTLVKYANQKNGDYERGVAVDILPLCNYSDNKQFKKRFEHLIKINKLFSYTARRKQLNHYSLKDKSIMMVCRLLSMVGLNKLYWNKKLYDFLSIQQETGEVFNPFSFAGYKDIHPKQCFSESFDHDFEGQLFKCPVGYDKVLTRIYGDYMQLPPIEKRISPHNTVVYSLED